MDAVLARTTLSDLAARLQQLLGPLAPVVVVRAPGPRRPLRALCLRRQMVGVRVRLLVVRLTLLVREGPR